MGEVTTIGLDIAKSVFQIHGVDAGGAVVIRRRITRAKLLEFFASLPACLVGIEACPTAHYWSRRLQALGHTVRLLPPSYVKAYLKRSKNDANDAALRHRNVETIAPRKGREWLPGHVVVVRPMSELGQSRPKSSRGDRRAMSGIPSEPTWPQTPARVARVRPRVFDRRPIPFRFADAAVQAVLIPMRVLTVAGVTG
jgi:hypothetical protein